jgi:prepilin-type N-terminal cleavage/methylation domain-containing protein
MTLVELMVSLAIFGVVMGVIFGFLSGARNSYSDTRERVQYQQAMRAVMSLMTREVRSTGCDPTAAGFESFGFAGGNILQCRMDLNADGDTSDLGPDESVTYAFNAATGELLRFDGAQAMIVLRGLNNLSFTYYNANGAVMGAVPLNSVDRSLVRYVEVLLDGETLHGEPVNYTTRIAVRNG